MDKRAPHATLFTLIGAALLLAGCAGAPLLVTPGPGESAGQPTKKPVEPMPPLPPGATPGTPIIPAGTTPPGGPPTGVTGPIVGTALPSQGPITGPPLRDITPVLPPPPNPTPLTPDASGAVTATLADNGRTVHLQPGNTLHLVLDTAHDWTVTVADPAILRATGPLTAGQGSYQAGPPGSTTIQAVGDLPCRKADPPCGAPSLTFSLAVVVR